MYDYNNIDKSKEDGLQEWYQMLTQTTTPYNENRVTQTLQKIWERIKPTHSTKGTSRYHR
tara:strand:+ start:566 stop:745 length:180 start_codon:yes stop_codon:yes gene_type:complete